MRKQKTYYHTNGLPKEKGTLVNGIKNGFWIMFDKDGYGRIVSEGTFLNGKKEGQFTEYDWRRGLIYSTHYKNGRQTSKRLKGRINFKTYPLEESGIDVDDFERLAGV